eukprot:7120762-Pyramimonas_sp.AAC.1
MTYSFKATWGNSPCIPNGFQDPSDPECNMRLIDRDRCTLASRHWTISMASKHAAPTALLR